MKKFFKKIEEKIHGIAMRTKTALTGKNGEGYIDTAVKIIISVVIGGVILAGLYVLFNTTVIPTLSEKITGMFSYSG